MVKIYKPVFWKAFCQAALTIIITIHCTPVFAQADTSWVELVDRQDTLTVVPERPVLPDTDMAEYDSLYYNLRPMAATVNKKRTLTVAGLHIGLYAGSLLILNQAWYAGYPRSSFHFFNDNAEWQQVDKVGHTWTAYQISRTSMASWEWAGQSDKKKVWLGGLSGAAFQTVIEVLDGFSDEWGWSWGDFAANCVGSGLLIGQQLGWGEQRISFKFSFHKKNYNDPMLTTRSNQLFGKSLPERSLKDYNGQTYWLSANLHAFFKQSKLPPWLNVALGYGADGMFGGYTNRWVDEGTGVAYNRDDIARVRQWYLAPDIDFTKIKTNKKWLRSVLFVLNAFKMPAPALVLSKGKLGVKAFYF